MVDSLIVLYESTCTEFENNGLGSLPDAISCSVVMRGNDEYEFEMEYPVTGKRFEELSLRKIIVSKPTPYDDPQPFRIYSISKIIDGIVTVNAEHISYDLSGYPVSSFKAETAVTAFDNMKDALVLPCPFTFFTDKTTVATMTVDKPINVRSLLFGTEGSMLDVYGGEYEFDKFSVKLWNRLGKDRGVSIRYGKNLTDLEQEENCSAVYTGIYPFWSSDEDGLVELKEKVLKADGEYNFTRIYVLDLSDEWQEPPSEEQLRSRAQSYMKANKIGVPKVSLKVSFISLTQSEEHKDYALLETVRRFDTVNVEFPELKVSATSKCIGTDYNVLTGKYNSIELGDSKPNIVDTIVEQEINISKTPTKTFMEQAIDNATKLISGGLGGYVVLHSSTGGNHPDEILIMDTDNILTATKVWRWNSGGLGYSSTGYNGDFGLAMTMDGAIVADFITTGILQGSLLAANSVQSMAISQGFKSDITNEIGQSAKSIEQKFITADGQLLSSITTTLKDYCTTTQTASMINQTSDKIMLEVGKKVGNSEWSTKIRQSPTDIQFAWNNISSVIQFANAELNIKDKYDPEEAKRLFSLGMYGMRFYDRQANILGHIGLREYMRTGYHSMSFNLDKYGQFLSWSVTNSEDVSYIMFAYYKSNVIKPKGFHFSDKVFLDNASLHIGTDVDSLSTVVYSNGGGFKLGENMPFDIYSTGDVRMFSVNNRDISCYAPLNMQGYGITNQSDARLKKNIIPSEISALKVINSIQLMSFDWIETEEHEQIGMIAQQLQEIEPSLVYTDPDTGLLSIKTTAFIPYLIRAVQELTSLMNISSPVNNSETWVDPYTLKEKTEAVAKNKNKPKTALNPIPAEAV